MIFSTFVTGIFLLLGPSGPSAVLDVEPSPVETSPHQHQPEPGDHDHAFERCPQCAGRYRDLDDSEQARLE